MLARRLLIALAVLMALTALAAGLAPRPTPTGDGGQATPTPSGEPPAEPVEATLDAQSEGQRVEARVGQIVRIVVNSSELDSVSVAEVGTETAEPDSPALFELHQPRVRIAVVNANQHVVAKQLRDRRIVAERHG